MLTIKKIMYKPPATIVFWNDGTKTVAVCEKGDVYNKELGFALCVLKKKYGNKTVHDMLDKYEECDWHIDLKTARELEIINDHIEEEIEPVEIKMSDMIKQLESSGYTVVNDLKETKEKKKTKKENK